MSTRVCTQCGNEKQLDEFYRKGGSKVGFRSKCIQCVQQYYHDNRQRIRQRDLQRMYGISLTEYDQLLDGQGGVCAICGKTPTENGMRLSVDHDHTTGKVRGLLCDTCNFAIGAFNDDVHLMMNARIYLESFSEVD